MSRSTFAKLLLLVGSQLRRDEEMGRKSGREVIAPDVRLGVLLRMMAGARVYECMSAFELGRSTTYDVFHATKRSLGKVLDLPGIPESVPDLCKMSEDFQTSRVPGNPLPGCVGALDGISIKIKKPPNHEQPASFYCRKGYYAIPVQAVCDSNYRFLCYSAKCRGSTHDSLAHAVSSLGDYLEQGSLDARFWIAGDEAYVCTNSLITPVPASQANDFEDAFNFYHSSLRMHIEQAFGMLVAKWRILRFLNFSVNDSAEIIGLAMKLHNFCLEHGETVLPSAGRASEERQFLDKSQEWYEEAKENIRHQIGEQNGESSSEKRDSLIYIVKNNGYQRPAVVSH